MALSRALLLAALLPILCRCTAQKQLRHAYTQELGVTHVQMLGQMRNSLSDRLEDVIFHAFIRLRRYQSSAHGLLTVLYGIGWIESITTGRDSQYAPEHLPYVDGLPQMWLAPVPRAHGEPEDKQEVEVLKGSDGSELGSKKMGFRLSAAFNSLADVYYLELAGWPRFYEIPLHNTARPGLITPWFQYNDAPAMARSPGTRRRRRRWKARTLQIDGTHQHATDLPDALTTRGSRDLTADEPRVEARTAAVKASGATSAAPAPGPPLMVVTSLMYKQTQPAQLQFLARQLIRHVEYHLVTLGMQRYLVYVNPSLWYDGHFTDYLNGYMPAQLLPYITIVLWNEMFQTRNYPWYYDQHIRFYHADVALWGYQGALGALIDVDEYIAFPAPAATLHQALHRCNASGLDWIRLPMVQHACESCLARYAGMSEEQGGEQGSVDMELWSSMAAGASTGKSVAVTPIKECSLQELMQANEAPRPSGGCSWWKEDPLRQYTRSINDQMYLDTGATHEELGTPAAWNKSEAKHLIKGSAMVAFMHHRGEIMAGRPWAWMPPAQCPYIAHLAHLNGFRPQREGAQLRYFDPIKISNWWLVNH